MKKWLSIIVIGIFIIVSCASCANILDDTKRTKTEGALAGAGIGAVAGGVLGYMIGGRSGAVQGAALGAGLGGGLGYGYGTHIAKKKEEFASEEEWLDSNIQLAEQTNKEMTEYNAKLGAEINRIDGEVAQLEKDYRNKKATQDDIKEKKESVDQMLTKLNEQIEGAKKELSSQEEQYNIAKNSENVSQEKLKNLEIQIADMRKNISGFEEHSTALSSISERTSV